MAILAYDDVMLREPRLLVPGMQPLGLVKLNSRYSTSFEWAVIGGRNRNFAEGKGQPTVGSAAVVETGATGLRWFNSSSASGGMTVPFYPSSDLAGRPWLWLYRGIISKSTTAGKTVGISDGSGHRFYFGAGSTPASFAFFGFGSFYSSGLTCAFTPIWNAVSTQAIYYPGSGDIAWYQDGKLLTTYTLPSFSGASSLPMDVTGTTLAAQVTDSACEMSAFMYSPVGGVRAAVELSLDPYAIFDVA